ncbi:hypothetical protein [Segetibacter koreensis]|uniref:hypothetical protein n=1 Tax=Segetibacter koreensis TaxID=398037 RepID=UPI000376E853|nr:hypothetical protein [Segetibacter koreensis]
MKKFVFVYFVAISFGVFSALSVQAQDTTSAGHHIKKGAKKTESAISKGAKKVGNKTAELASKGKAGIVDKVYEEKQGPNGQTIYINHHSKYYWIDKKGHKHFVAKSKLKDKNP